MWRNSHRPNQIVMAILGMSWGWTGIWWYPLEFNVREYVGAGQAGGEILEMRDGVAIWCGSQVEEAVVSAWAPFTIGLGGHVEGGCPLAAGRPHDPQMLRVSELVISNSEFRRRKAAGAGPHRSAVSGNVVEDAVCGGRG